MKEAVFNTEIVRSLKEAGWFAHKLTDMPMVPGLRFQSDKPCDILSVVHGVAVAIESKQFKKFQGFSIRYLRDNQVESLDQIQKSGGRSYVFLNIRIPNIKGVQKRENRCYIIDWEAWDKQPIPVKDIRENLPYVCGKNGLFDLTIFIDGCYKYAN